MELNITDAALDVPGHSPCAIKVGGNRAGLHVAPLKKKGTTLIFLFSHPLPATRNVLNSVFTFVVMEKKGKGNQMEMKELSF